LTREAVPPACQTQVTIFTPFASSSLTSSRPISAFFQAKPWSYEVTMQGISPILSSCTSPPA
jgi:hypothetical protein